MGYPSDVAPQKPSPEDAAKKVAERSLSEEDGDELPPAPPLEESEDEDIAGGPEMGSPGHSRQLRRRLRAARLRLGLSHGQVAERVAKRLGIDSRTGGSISHYEEFRRHPRIDVMAAWARAVDLRLIVDLDDAEGKRIPVMLRHRTADLARVLDNATDEDFEMIQDIVYRILKVEPD
jgi:transcriptional regulator with XRE-family HTH domain